MTQDQLKRAAAQAALDLVLPQLTGTSVLGIGTGSTTAYFIDALAPYKDRFAGAVASSSGSADKLHALNIPQLDLNDLDHVDFYIDGADEATAELQLIKGGGAALTREKIIADVATTFVCIVDASKCVSTLGKFPLPVEVIPLARNHVARQLQRIGGRPIHRTGVVTDNGGHILDVHDLVIQNPLAVEAEINQFTGVITNGLFARRPADILLVATGDGIKTVQRPQGPL